MQHDTMVYKVVAHQELSVHTFNLKAKPATDQKTAIAFFHGGGWAFGAPSEFFEACRRYARMGYVTFSFQYRLSKNSDGTYPNPDITPIEAVKDARSAIRWIRENANSFQIKS